MFRSRTITRDTQRSHQRGLIKTILLHKISLTSIKAIRPKVEEENKERMNLRMDSLKNRPWRPPFHTYLVLEIQGKPTFLAYFPIYSSPKVPLGFTHVPEGQNLPRTPEDWQSQQHICPRFHSRTH